LDSIALHVFILVASVSSSRRSAIFHHEASFSE
jgi:hypothetical protein